MQLGIRVLFHGMMILILFFLGKIGMSSLSMKMNYLRGIKSFVIQMNQNIGIFLQE